MHIETAEFIPGDTEWTSLFIQLQDIIRNSHHPIFITHNRPYMSLPGPLVKYNAEIGQLLAENELKASEFHKRHHGDSKGLQKDFRHTPTI